ncbi:endonuclease domain-containing protein [Kineococcus gynurae]|uniref:Endonuclease domain-containing protein n=1 Tax=Kineococcus gynurae TaxID=452979 RepID=A0ABV5LUT6_9ACTN
MIRGTVAAVDAVTALRRLGGAGRRRELRQVRPGALDRAVREGTVLHPARGVFVLPECEPAHRAAVLVDGELTCEAGAREHGLDLLLPGDGVHVRCARGSELTWPRVTVHRRGRAGDGSRVAPLLTVLLDLPGCLPLPEAVAALDGALRRGRVDHDDLRARVAHLPPGDPRRRTVDLADGRADSVLESVVRVELLARGRTVELQHAEQGVGHVDLLVDGWLVVELDGFAFHHDRSQFREDRRRLVELVRAGRTVLRFTYEDVAFARPRMLDVIEEVLASGPLRTRFSVPG